MCKSVPASYIRKRTYTFKATICLLSRKKMNVDQLSNNPKTNWGGKGSKSLHATFYIHWTYCPMGGSEQVGGGGSKKSFHCIDKKSNLESQFFRKYVFFCTLQLDCVNGIKMTYILIIFQKNMEVAVFTENRVRGEPLKKDFVWRYSLLEDSKVLTAIQGTRLGSAHRQVPLPGHHCAVLQLHTIPELDPSSLV